MILSIKSSSDEISDSKLRVVAIDFFSTFVSSISSVGEPSSSFFSDSAADSLIDHSALF